MRLRSIFLLLVLAGVSDAQGVAGSNASPAGLGTGSPPGLQQGPFVGHVEPTRAFVWARAAGAGPRTLELTAPDTAVREFLATADAEHDLCVVWTLEDLSPDTRYDYRVAGQDHHLRTAPLPEADGATRLFIGSCAREDEPTARVWRQAASEQVDVVLLLGDTPYIDTTDLALQRARHAAFASVEPMAALLRSTPWYGTWDDHDFGANDIDGRLAGKADSRRAFIEYHANPSYGDGEHGIYTSFRRGAVEVFLLDTRYFAATEPSPYHAHRASLLGAAQWEWLRTGLAASTAPVKLLACGMIWNGATRPGKQDHWGTYAHERQSLFQFLGEQQITGVVLVGGDIHRSRVIRHDTRALAGYDIHELISSPMHAGVIASANAPHPGLIKDMGEPSTFLLLEAAQRDGELTRLDARFVNGAGEELFRIDLRSE